MSASAIASTLFIPHVLIAAAFCVLAPILLQPIIVHSAAASSLTMTMSRSNIAEPSLAELKNSIAFWLASRCRASCRTHAETRTPFQHVLYRRYACLPLWPLLRQRSSHRIAAFQSPICLNKMTILQLAMLLLSHFVILAAGFAPQSVVDVASSSSTALQAKRLPITMPTQTPMVPYRPPGSDYAQFVGIYDRMVRDRILFIGNFIDEENANSIISSILYLRKEDSTGPITLYLNVPGALLRPGLAVYDLLRQIGKDCEITTVNIGLCTGMGALLAGAGTKGRRCALPNSRFLLQRVGMESPFQGQATDIALEVKNVKKMNDNLDMELSKMTGQTAEKCREDMKRDFYLSADEAVRYGLIDKVLQPAPRKRATQGQDTDLGAFEGEDQQRYQDQKTEGGNWGKRRGPPGPGGQAPPGAGGGSNDDDPPIQKGG